MKPKRKNGGQNFCKENLQDKFKKIFISKIYLWKSIQKQKLLLLLLQFLLHLFQFFMHLKHILTQKQYGLATRRNNKQKLLKMNEKLHHFVPSVLNYKGLMIPFRVPSTNSKKKMQRLRIVLITASCNARKWKNDYLSFQAYQLEQMYEQTMEGLLW